MYIRYHSPQIVIVSLLNPNLGVMKGISRQYFHVQCVLVMATER
jgi:hypothetical protein